jgi:integrase
MSSATYCIDRYKHVFASCYTVINRPSCHYITLNLRSKGVLEGQRKRKANDKDDGSTSYHSFINAIRSPSTKTGYGRSLRRYMRYHKILNTDDLLKHESITNPKLIESQIIDYIMSLRNDGVGYSTIRFLIEPIFTFYQLNDVLINKKKVNRYLPEYKKVVKDRAYSSEQIQQALQNADQRMRMIILILSSTGCRIGALPLLKLGHLSKTKIPEGLYKIVFYEGTSNEYYTFTTRECATTGIDNYLEYRKRCGEKLSFNPKTNRWEPEDAPLIRLQFDVTDVLQARNPKPMTLQGLRIALDLHLVKSGLRQVEHPLESESESESNHNGNENKRIRKPISLSNGFRKHVISTFIEAQLSHEIRELIVDHATHLDQNYFRPTEDQVLQEYLKAESLLTIDPSLRLQNEIQTLKMEKSVWEAMRKDIDELKKFMPKG